MSKKAVIKTTSVAAPVIVKPNTSGPRVLVGIVTKPGHHMEFRDACKAAIREALFPVKVRYEIFETENPGLCWEGHNVLIDRVLKEGWDYLWSVDADVIVGPKSFEYLLSDDVDGAYGTYDNEIYRKYRDNIKNAEVYNGLLIAGQFIENPPTPYAFKSFYVRDIEGKVIFDKNVWGGEGCSLYKRRIFETGLRTRYVIGGPGHDLVFQSDAWKAGFKLCLDGRVICEHLD